jgi:hypothetical protein
VCKRIPCGGGILLGAKNPLRDLKIGHFGLDSPVILSRIARSFSTGFLGHFEPDYAVIRTNEIIRSYVEKKTY